MTIEDWVTLRLAKPWAGRIIDHDGGETDAMALYERYVADMDAAGDSRVLSHKLFGVAMGADPRLSRRRTKTGWFYTGLTVETRAERAEASVRPDLFRAAMSGQRDHPGYAKWRAHQDLHRRDWSVCDHESKDPVIVALLAEVETAVANHVPAAAEAQYGPWLRWSPGEPDPGVAIYRAEDEAARDTIIAQLAVMEAEDAAAKAAYGAAYDAAKARQKAAVAAIVPPAIWCDVTSCEDSAHWSPREKYMAPSTWAVDPDENGRGEHPIIAHYRGGGHIDMYNLPENAAHRETNEAAKGMRRHGYPPEPRRDYTRESKYRSLRDTLKRLTASLDGSLDRAYAEFMGRTISAAEDPYAGY